MSAPKQVTGANASAGGLARNKSLGGIMDAISNLKLPTRRIVSQDADHESVSSTPYPAAQAASSGADQGVGPTSALPREAADINISDLDPLRKFDTVIEQMSNVPPFAKLALRVLSSVAKMTLDQANCEPEVRPLLVKLVEIYGFISQEMTPSSESMFDVVGRVAEKTLECALFMSDYSEPKNFRKRVKKNVASETDFEIQRHNNVLDMLMQDIRDRVTRDSDQRTGEILSGMNYVAGAGLDTTKQCLPETRTEILSEITEWINSSGDEVPRVLWLSGPAGTGKSAIAHTIARDVGVSVSCFFCFNRHREADRRHEKIFSTIARDLADCDPKMRQALMDAVMTDSAVKNTTDIIQQWQCFIMEPLIRHSVSNATPVVIVIDALDESGDVDTRQVLLRILAGTLQHRDIRQITELPNNVRFIVTSRPLRDIDDEFRDVQHIRRISMDDIPAASTERDIRRYISHELKGLLEDSDFAVLAEKAEGLFEWARLACSYIKAPPVGLFPLDSFKIVVSSDPGMRRNLLSDMYLSILTEIMGKDVYPNATFQTTLVRFHSVMGQILGLAEPLPLHSLNAMRRHFPDSDDRYKADVVVNSMGSLLSGTTKSDAPIRLLHPSFGDFLTDKMCSGDFFVDMAKARRNLAFASLRVMEDELRFNICNLKSSYIPNCEECWLPERVEKYISPHLSYSCRLWATHIREVDFDTEIADNIRSFFDSERLLFWLEALGLLKAVSRAADALPLIIQWLKTWSKYRNVSLAAVDVQKFIQIFGGIISYSTPHLYISALPFSPIKSVISRNFSPRFPNTLRLISGRDENWTAVQSTLSGHMAGVLAVSLSPDATRIATGSHDQTVRIWDAATGLPLGKPLRGHTGSVNSVSFSPDGNRIISGSHDQTVRVWDAATGQPVVEPLRGHTGSVNSVSFSPDGTCIISGSHDKTVRLWDAATWQPVGEPLLGHTDAVTSVSFSPDGTRITSGSHDQTVRVWNPVTGQPVVEPLRGHTGSVNSVSFSPDGTRIISGSHDKTMRLWDAATGQPVGGPLLGHTDVVSSVSFSPDGTRIISGSHDKTVRLWHVATWQPVGEPLLGHIDAVTSVSFSPNRTRIISGSHDKTVRLWDAASGVPLEECVNQTCSTSSLDTSRIVHPTNEYDGWTVGPNHQLLFWVPPASRREFYTPETALAIPRGRSLEVDLSHMKHGQQWSHCRE